LVHHVVQRLVDLADEVRQWVHCAARGMTPACQQGNQGQQVPTGGIRLASEIVLCKALGWQCAISRGGGDCLPGGGAERARGRGGGLARGALCAGEGGFTTRGFGGKGLRGRGGGCDGLGLDGGRSRWPLGCGGFGVAGLTGFRGWGGWRATTGGLVLPSGVGGLCEAAGLDGRGCGGGLFLARGGGKLGGLARASGGGLS
jgi:hypothetical protein